VFSEVAGFSLREVLERGEPVVGIERIQPVLVGVQLALVGLWAGYGVSPDAVVGHSMGEVAAAVVAGALSVRQGFEVIVARSRLLARLSGCGAMALLEVDAETAGEVIAGFEGVSVAVYASPRQTVIAGPPGAVDEVVGIVDGWGRLARRVDVDVASHNPIVDPVLEELAAQLADLRPQPARVAMFSTAGVDDQPLFDARYWVA
ncbi:acyltransferase domain-containing protein, partial [Mycolicibacillus trivialis]